MNLPGVLCYEMLNGYSPFEAKETLQTYQKILEGAISYPAVMDADARDLISRLLQKDISRRLGNLRDGAKDIKRHALYAPIEWAAPFAYRASITPPPFDATAHKWEGAELVVLESKPSHTFSHLLTPSQVGGRRARRA